MDSSCCGSGEETPRGAKEFGEAGGRQPLAPPAPDFATKPLAPPALDFATKPLAPPALDASQTVFVTLCDQAYFPRARQTIADLRVRGRWSGEVLLLTVGFDVDPEILAYYGVEGRRIESLAETRAVVEAQRAHPISKTDDNREKEKLCQFDKLQTFAPWIQERWRRVVFLDAGLRVCGSVGPLLELPWEGKFLAQDDVFRDDKTFALMWEPEANPAAAVRFREQVDPAWLRQHYFLNCMWVYDTALRVPLEAFLQPMRDFPFSRTNEMAIMNLVLAFQWNVWKPFPVFVRRAPEEETKDLRLFGWSEHDRDYGSETTWRDFCFIKYSVTMPVNV